MNKSQLYIAAGLVLGSLLMSGVTKAAAQAVNAEQACTPDVMRLCNEFIPDRGRITACLRAKRHQLSRECSAVMSPKAKTKHKSKQRRARSRG
jgi:hypothetical protein